jgi:hypothetical protein
MQLCKDLDYETHKMQVLNFKEDTRCCRSSIIETYVFGFHLTNGMPLYYQEHSRLKNTFES